MNHFQPNHDVAIFDLNLWSNFRLTEFHQMNRFDSRLTKVRQMNKLNFQQMEFRHVKLNFQQKEMQQMQLLEPIQHNSQSLQSCATAL